MEKEETRIDDNNQSELENKVNENQDNNLESDNK